PDSKIFTALHTALHTVLPALQDEETTRAGGNKKNWTREGDRIAGLAPLIAKVARMPKRSSYLDIGCNEGGITKAFGAHIGAAETIGCDIIMPPSERTPNFQFVLMDEPYKLPFTDGAFDVVSMFMMLHHVQ